MDNNTVIVIGIFAAILIVALVFFRKGKGIKANVEGPLNTKLSFDASNPEPTPGAIIEDAKSHRGGIRADDQIGSGASVRRVEAQDDIVATSKRQEGNIDPKT